MISMAARCSEVCGWGQDSFPALRKTSKNNYQLEYITAQCSYGVIVSRWHMQITKKKGLFYIYADKDKAIFLENFFVLKG